MRLAYKENGRGIMRGFALIEFRLLNAGEALLMRHCKPPSEFKIEEAAVSDCTLESRLQAVVWSYTSYNL
jgi:hypothetical protein